MWPCSRATSSSLARSHSQTTREPTADVSGNSAGSDGGVSTTLGSLRMTDTIVAGQTGGGDVVGSYTGGNNLIGGNPLLAPLGNYGGPTVTMALLPGSPATRGTHGYRCGGRQARQKSYDLGISSGAGKNRVLAISGFVRIVIRHSSNRLDALTRNRCTSTFATS